MMEPPKYPTYSIALDQLETNPLQPLKRMTDAAVRALVETITDTKFIVPLAVVKQKSRYVICDGHRRAAAAKKLDLTHVDCCLVSEKQYPPSIWFLKLNRAVRTFKGHDWLHGWALAEDREEMMPHIPSEM